MARGHILHIFPTFGFGGVQLRIADVANRLGSAYRHTAIALDGRIDARARLWPETPFQVEDGSALPAGLSQLSAIRQHLQGYAADLLCSYNWGSMDWALAASGRGGPPHLHFESGFGADEASGPRLRRSLFRRLALRRTHALVVPSQTLYEIARGRRWITPERLQLIANGVDVAYYTRSAASAAPENAPPRVVTVAPLRREKRLDRLIAAADALSGEIELTICGDGPEREALEAAAQEAGHNTRIRFLGTLSDVRPALEEAEIFAVTSETEQMPNALLQAMAMELPVIAFDAGDIRIILPPEQRDFVFAQGDEAGFRDGLRALAKAPALRTKLAAANRQRACANYAMDAMVAAYERLYDDAMAAKR